MPGNLRMMALAHRALWQAAVGGAVPAGDQARPRRVRDHAAAAQFARPVPRDRRACRREARALFYGADGNPLPVGTMVRNPALARFLDGSRRAGRTVSTSAQRAGDRRRGQRRAAQSVADDAPATSRPTTPSRAPPVCGTYRGYRICGMGPSSSGGTTVFAILKQLERFDLAALGPELADGWHLIAESMRLAYADRDKYLADPGFRLGARRRPDRPRLSREPLGADLARPHHGDVVAGSPAGAPLARAVPAPERGTSHFVAVDSLGQCRFGDVDHRKLVRLGPDGQRLLSQQ